MSLLARFSYLILFIALLLNACSAGPTASPQVPGAGPASAQAPSPSQPPTVTAVPGTQAAPTPGSFGPTRQDFPAGYNPLTGQPVADLDALKLPAMLLSISNFPATARPQAGLSFANYVFEFSITEGATRFLSVFYGDFPRPEFPFNGECPVRLQPFVQTGQAVLGDRIWLDVNSNGIQEFAEAGVGGICVNLYDTAGNLLDQVVSDSHGYYGFNLPSDEGSAAGPFIVEVVASGGLRFTLQDAINDVQDSDVDPETGRFEVASSAAGVDFDAGMIPPPGITPTPDPARGVVPEKVGPIRSGRLVYADFANMFQESCLVYAFASSEVLEQIPACSMVTHDVFGGGYMLELSRMRLIAEDNLKADSKFDYASNLFTDEPPAGGVPGTQLDVYFAYLNQSGWRYEPLMHSYLRFTDTSEQELAGQLHPDTDRLTGRQLHFENIIVLFTEHAVISPTNLDIDLSQGGEGPAYLFRDGRSYPIRWNTKSGEYEKKTGFRRPIRWMNADGTLAPLKPGHTWVIIVTPWSPMEDSGGGVWKLRFSPPEGSK